MNHTNRVHIPVIVFTGGPCSGKTTILPFLKEELAKLGWRAIIVPETATELIGSGITPQSLGMVNFQQFILEHTLRKEDLWKRAALEMSGEKTVILCDRGVLDIPAYITDSHFNRLLDDKGHSIVGLRDGRYDAVIFLRSTAVDAPEAYTCANNGARTETIERAIELDRDTLNAWIGHPSIRVIDNSTDFEGKKARALNAVRHKLGIPEPLEIERRFRITRSDIGTLPVFSREIRIVQHYLKNPDPGVTERVRARGQGGHYIHFHTQKETVRPGVRNEIEKRITHPDYENMLERADPASATIKKTRRYFVWENQYFELDVFDTPDGLILLEVELTDEHDEVVLPDFLRHDAVEVTDDPSFSNSAIARRLAEQQGALV